MAQIILSGDGQTIEVPDDIARNDGLCTVLARHHLAQFVADRGRLLGQ
jgi:hypothetical protein